MGRRAVGAVPSCGVSGGGGPVRCPTCDGLVREDERPGWLYCPGCEWPVWMYCGGVWIRTPPPATVEVQERFERGLVGILAAVRDARARSGDRPERTAAVAAAEAVGGVG